MEELMEQEEKYIGAILPGQGWVELKGVFTISELEELMVKINSNYEKLEDDNS